MSSINKTCICLMVLELGFHHQPSFPCWSTGQLIPIRSPGTRWMEEKAALVEGQTVAIIRRWFHREGSFCLGRQGGDFELLRRYFLLESLGKCLDGLQVVVGGKYGIEVWILQFWLDMIHDSLPEPINCSSKNGLVILLKVNVVVQY